MREDEFKQLKEQRMQLVTELRSFSDAMQERASGNSGQILAEDQEEYDKREKDLIEINKRIEVESRTLQALAHSPESVQKFPAEGTPTTLNEFRTEQAGGLKPQDTPDVRRAIFSWITKGREGMEFDEYRVLSKAASGGGYFVPTDMADQVVRALRFLPGGVGTLARTISTSGGEMMNIPLNLTHGTAAWIAESASYTPSDETITQGTLSAYKAGTKIIVSEELLTDSAFDLSGFITQEFGERIGALAETAYITGDGSGKPTGITVAGSAVSASTLPAGYVTTPLYTGVAAALLAVPAQYRQNMSLLVSDSFYVKLAVMVDTTGRPVWTPSAAVGTPDTFAGIPVYSHPDLAAVGASSKSGIVGDFSRAYWIRRVDGVFMQRQNELHSDSGQVGFRAYLRLDGKVVNADALRIVTFAAT